MIKGIYKVRINSLVKDFFYFNSFANEGKQIIDEYNSSILGISGEMDSIANDEQFTPQEKSILINERLNKIEEIGAKISKVYNEVTERYDSLLKEKDILVTTFLDSNPDMTEGMILTEIEKEMKKLL
jgi:hypothetical protein